jgi:L-rhamnose mutarotase
MKRFGQIIKLRPGKEEEYKKLHRESWPGVLAQIRRSNIRNYTIFLHDGILFACYEYIGNDYEKDMAAMAADKTTQEWWKFTSACQESIDSTEPPEWKDIEEVFHTD